MARDLVVESLFSELCSVFDDSSLTNSNRCQDIVRQIYAYFLSEHTKSELDLSFSLLCKAENPSLLHFIERAVSNPTLKSGVKEALGVIFYLIIHGKFGDQLSQYVVSIKDVAYKCLLSSKSSDVKTKAYQVITAIVSSKCSIARGEDLNIRGLVTYLHTREFPQTKHLSSTVVEKMYELYGEIAKQFPETCKETIPSVVRLLLNDLNFQMNVTDSVKGNVISGCMLALKGIMVNFTQDHEEAPDVSKLIYSHVKAACKFNESNANRVFQRAALQVFSTHISQLWHWAMAEYNFWLNELVVWTNRSNSDDRKDGIAALVAFHKQAWTHLTQHSDSDLDKELMQVLLTQYKDTFTNLSASSFEMNLAVEGFGALASVSSKVMKDRETVAYVFRVILQRAQTESNSVGYGSSTANNKEYLSKYLACLSSMCRELKTVDSNQLTALQQLAGLIMEDYPHHLQQTQQRIVKSLATTIQNMSFCNGQALDRFLQHFVYQGVIVTCSQTLVEEAELQKDLTGKDVITYQYYLSFWKAIFRMGRDPKYTLPDATPEMKVSVLQKMYDSLIKALLTILEKLDVNYKKTDTEELEIKSDPESNLKGTKPQDHNILCNVANLYRDLLIMDKELYKMLEVDVPRLTKWLPKMIETLINRSIDLPLVSAFYKLLAAVLHLAEQTKFFQDESSERQSLGRYIVKYMEDLMVQCRQYKNDLQASCLLAIIAVPVQLIQPLLFAMPSTLEMIFQLGQSFLPLAYNGVETLKKWQRRLPHEHLKPILEQILPFFDPYLRSQGITNVVLEEDEEEEIYLCKKLREQEKRVTECTQLGRLQKRMLKLMSRLDSATCLSLLRQDITSAVAWTAEPTLTVKVPFPDQRPTICLDSLLPRVVELALTSSDRQAKTAACEVLHALVILFTGLGSTVGTTQDDKQSSLLRRLMPPLLQLSSGSDLVAKQLFHLLVMQLTHWFSSKHMLHRPQTAVLLEAIWDGLTDEKDTALRDFCALCLQEFVAWSIKQTSEQELAEHPLNIKAVVRQINTYCRHPSINKRIGAALAFNHLARLLREEVSLVDKFWVELLYNLVRSLSMPGSSQDHPASLALDHIAKVIHKNADLFNKESSERRVPAVLGKGLLKDVLQWLLLQCGSKSTVCAEKCRQLVVSLSPLVPDISGVADLVEAEDMVGVCEGGGEGSSLPTEPTSSDGESLRASLDCYVWCIRTGLVSPIIITRTPSKLIACTEYYLNTVNVDESNPTLRSWENKAQIQTQCAIIVALFDLLGLLDSTITKLPSSFWNIHLWKLVSLCVISPSIVGFDWRNRTMSHMLLLKLRGLLCTLREELGCLQDLYDQLTKLIEFLQLYDCALAADRLSLMTRGLLEPHHLRDSEYIRGLETLSQSNLLQHVSHGKSWDGVVLLRGVFASLFDANEVSLHPSTEVHNFANKLLSFAIILEVDVGVMLSCVLDESTVTDPLLSSSTKGQHFLSVFQDKVLTVLLREPKRAVDRLLLKPTQFTVNVTRALLDACKYSKTKFNSSTESLVNAIIANWTRLSVWAGTDAPLKAQLVDLLKALVLTFPASATNGCFARDVPYNSLPAWLFNQIRSKELKLEYKSDLIDLLRFVVVGDRTDYELQAVLDFLHLEHFPVSCSELRQGSIERSTFIAIYKALLRTMVSTGSIVVLRTVSLAAEDKEHACAELITVALKTFMRKHQKELQVKALNEVYAKFSKESNTMELRLGVVERFLVPMICEASKPAVTEFYAKIIHKMVDDLDKSETFDQERKNKQQLVTKIGTLQLAESMFNRFEKAEMENKTHPIVRAATNIKEKMTKYFASTLLSIRKCEEYTSAGLQELVFKMQCCAYKALMTFICNTDQSEILCNAFLFKETVNNKIWSKLIPNLPKLSFPIEFDDYPRMKKQLVQIRSVAMASTHQAPEGGSAVYLPSQSLFNSSLQEDFMHFDFSMYNVRDEDRLQQMSEQNEFQTNAGFDLEEDSLNSHECMATLCGVVKYLCDKPPLVQEEGQELRLPLWMDSLRASLTDTDQPDNCKAFLVKLIMNCESYFKPYASYWLAPILQCAVDKCLGGRFNYLLHDVVGMLYDWHTVAIPNSASEKFLASEFLRQLVLYTPNERRGVFRYNLEVVKSVVTMWKSCASIPYQELLDLIALSPGNDKVTEPGLLLADIFLSHDMLPFNDIGKPFYCRRLLANLQSPVCAIHKPCAAVIGKVLKILSKGRTQQLTKADEEFYAEVESIVNLKDSSVTTEKNRNIQQFIVSLHRIQAFYPRIVKSYTLVCITNLSMPSSYRVMLLEILTTALDFDFRTEAFSMLHLSLREHIKDDNNPDTQVAALKFVKKLMPSLTTEQMSELLPHVMPLQTHRKAECRAVVYDIVSWIYDNYKDLTDGRAQTQVQEARSVLIAGLSDPDKQLQATLYKFWTINDRLSSDVCERLLVILRLLYVPSNEETFLPIIVTLLLQSCEKTNEFTENIFSHQLHECAFEKYQVSVSWRTQHAAFVPMFAETLVSQISSASLGSFNDMPPQLRSTQSPSSLYSSSLHISVVNKDKEEMSLCSFGGQSATSGLSSRSYKQGMNFGSELLSPVDETDGDKTKNVGLKRMRFMKDQQKLSQRCATMNIIKSEKLEKTQAERVKRKEGDVKLTRDYRKGDFPDIQIPYSDFINSLKNLAQRDRQVARQLLVCIYQSLVIESYMATSLPTALDNILQTSTCHEPSLMAAVLEMSLLHPTQCQASSEVIAEVSKNSQQTSLGALLMEARLMAGTDSSPPTKKARSNVSNVNYDDWMYLAEIYHSMEEKDVVQGLFEDKIGNVCAATVREAMLMEDQYRWKRAGDLYAQAIEGSRGTPAENYFFEASFKCCAHLGQWRDLNKSLKINELGNKLDNVWIDNWKRDHVLPWLFMSEIHCAQETDVHRLSADFDTAFSAWMLDTSHAQHVKSKLGEYHSIVLLLKNDVYRSKFNCENSIQDFLNRWQTLDALSSQQRACQLLRVQSLLDIQNFLSLPQATSADFAKSTNTLLNHWKKTTLSASDDLVAWQTRAAYRNIFVKKLLLQTSSPDLLSKLDTFQMDNYLKTLNFALEQKNYCVSDKFIRLTDKVKGVTLHARKLSLSKCKLLKGELTSEQGPKKLERILSAWSEIKELRGLNAVNRLDLQLLLNLHKHTADFYSALLSVVQEPSYTPTEDLREKLHEHLDNNDGDIPSQLRAKFVSSLQQAVEGATAEQLADCYFRLANFCHQQEGSLYERSQIECLLRAMRYGSLKARRLFPCLLQLPSLPSHADLFIKESRLVPEWMFLSWVNQLLASLDTEIGSALAPLLIQLATAYPAALRFPFQLSCEMYNYNYPATEETVKRLETLLELDTQTVTLLRALSCVCQPHLSLIYHIDRLKLSLSKDESAFAKAYCQMVEEAYPPKEGDYIKGRAFNDVKAFTDQLELLVNQLKKKTLSIEEFAVKLCELNVLVNEDSVKKGTREKRTKRIELSSFSPWLVDGYEGEVEIPGQYTGECKPIPQHHTTIIGFKRHVKPMQSLRAPIQITLLGNDARDHPYLVKFGEDLRQDQRIQQLFRLMNQMLRDDINSSRRQLSVDTYSVIPLNSRLGIIEWVEQTTVLKDFMLRDKELQKQAENATRVFNSLFVKCPQKSASFYRIVTREESVAVYRKAVNELPKFMLRDAVWRLAVNPTAFFHLRAEMLRSHACLSTCHWLLGIGDRHLSNTLVRLDTGRFLGIDFGHAFGTATQLLPIPELIPLRLTPQIVNLAAPLCNTGVLKETMVHTLRVLRNNERLLLATMTVFILEPSLDWLKAAQKHPDYCSESGVDWYPQEKIRTAQQKLEGAHPRSVTEQELCRGHEHKPQYPSLLKLLRDDGGSPAVKDMPATGLTPRQQVECLIAQATNEHILSKAFSGLMSWM